MAPKFLLPTLALAGTALAQSSLCGNGGTLTINSQADVTQLSGCAPFNGSIEISKALSGSLQLNGFSGVTGDLTAIGAENITSITSDLLQIIQGEFRLEGLTSLSTLQMDSIRGVDTLTWMALPQLQSLNFARGITLANTVLISNTGLRDLKGIELNEVGSVDINNNQLLNTVNVNNLANVTQFLSFSANGRQLNIMLPNLKAAGNLTFRDVASVTIPSLSQVDGDMGFYVDSFANFSAANLTTVVKSVAFVGCQNLVDLELPKLNTIGGGFLIANNTVLQELTGLPSLARIGGAIDFSGDFTAISLPMLSDVRGSTNIQSSANNASICSQFSSSNDVFSGKVNCEYNKAQPQSNVSGTVTGSGGKDGKSGASAFASNSVALLTSVVGVIAAVFLL